MQADDATWEAYGGRIWRTRQVPEHERFAYWREVVWQAFVPLAPVRLGGRAFEGTVESRRLGPLGLARITSGAQRVLRTERLIAHRDDGAAYLNLQVAGHGTVSQDGRTARLTPGDLALVDGSRPFALEFAGDFRQICLTVPLEVLTTRVGLPELASARRIEGSTGAGAVVSAALAALAAQAAAIDRGAARGMADHLAGLLAIALEERPPRCAPGGDRLLGAAMREARGSLADPALSPTSVASRVGVSSGQLHRLFAARGLTFGRWIREQRLQRCRLELADPAHDHRGVAEIAAAWGFASPAHFSRVFRRAYGMAPGAWRERRGDGAAPDS
jgi:AraC-like DNA-binding protein